MLASPVRAVPDFRDEKDAHEEELNGPEGYEDDFQPWGFAGKGRGRLLVDGFAIIIAAMEVVNISASGNGF